MTAELTIEELGKECRELHQEVRDLKTAVLDSELRILNRLAIVLTLLDEMTVRPGERL